VFDRVEPSRLDLDPLDLDPMVAGGCGLCDGGGLD
jgi:hypothetical protein